jgi:hypothetical protein
VERDDDDDLRTREIFGALRRHIVRVSSDFGARMAVRLLALAAAREHGDPSLLDVFARTLREGTTLLLLPLTRAEEQSSAVTSADKEAEDDTHE